METRKLLIIELKENDPIIVSLSSTVKDLLDKCAILEKNYKGRQLCVETRDKFTHQFFKMLSFQEEIFVKNSNKMRCILEDKNLENDIVTSNDKINNNDDNARNRDFTDIMTILNKDNVRDDPKSNTEVSTCLPTLTITTILTKTSLTSTATVAS